MTPDVETLRRELEALRSRNRELEETLDALQSGELDAIVVRKGNRRQVYTLEGADHPYRVLVENIQEGALTLTGEGMVLYANTAFAAMLRQSPSGIIGTHLRDHIMPRDRGLFDDLLLRSRGGPGRAVMRICSGAGSVPVVISMTPIVVHESPRLSVVVSNRKEDYDRLLLQSRMLDAVGDAVIATDPSNRIIYWSESAARIYGWQATEAMGRSLDELVAGDLSPDDARRRDEQLGRGETWSGEYRARHRDGHLFPVKSTKAPVYNEDGQLVAVIGVSHDISERKGAEAALRESEARFRSVLDQSTDVIYRYNLQTHRIEYISPSCEAVVGFTPVDFETITAEKLLTMLHPEDRLPMQATYARLERTGDAEVEYRFGTKDGEYRWLSNRMSLVRDAQGRPLYRDGNIRDISRRKRAETALHEYAERLQRSNEELQRFAYVASHDLQEPLRAIVSFSQLLERRYRGRLDSDADEYIEFIVEGGKRMQRLITDLLQVSRVETQARPLEPVDPMRVVTDALSVLNGAVREAGGTVTVGELPAVMADAAQLEQALSNLISNAIKYRRPEVPLEVAISARTTDDMVEFAVKDNGIGIEAEYYDRIFEMFRRLHTHDKYEGTGIGLAVVKRIVERHGGRIWLESVPGEGSTFLFTLPAA